MAPFWAGFILVAVAVTVFRAVKSLVAELISALLIIGGMAMIANASNLNTPGKAVQFVSFLTIAFVGSMLMLAAQKDEKEVLVARIVGLALAIIGVLALAFLAGWPDASGITDALWMIWGALKKGAIIVWNAFLGLFR